VAAARTGKKTLVHMVSAWAEATVWYWPSARSTKNPTKITAIPKLLDALELAGTVVTIDAMGCQRAIAEKIRRQESRLYLAVKENQGHLLEEIKDSFRQLPVQSVAEKSIAATGESNNARCSVIADLGLIEKAAEWPSFTGAGAYRGRTISQGHGQDRA